LASGEETTTSQITKASNCHVPKVHVHHENTQFSIDQLMECQLQMCEVTEKRKDTMPLPNLIFKKSEKKKIIHKISFSL
jgi:hypothetical protein